jgi:hypothetical protein
MGQRQSKPSTFEIRNDTDVAIHFNPSFLERLESLDKPTKTVHQSEVEERVEKELKAHEQKRLLHEKRSVQLVDREAQDLIDRQFPLPEMKISPEMERLQQNVINCYRVNAGKVLDCQEQVLQFQKAERELLHNFIASQ